MPEKRLKFATEEERRESKREWKRRYRKEQPEKFEVARKRYYEANKEKILARRKERYKNNKEEENRKQKERNLKNPEKHRESNRRWEEKNKEHRKKYHLANRDKINARSKQWVKDNRGRSNESKKRWQREREETDVVFKFTRRLRTLINGSFKRRSVDFKKSSKTVQILGCTIEFFIDYITKQCGKDLSLKDFGRFGYHLDHKIPISFAKTEEDVIRLNHYTNFQPLWWEDNLKKHNKING